MRSSPVMRAARVCAAAAFVFSLGLAPSYARMGGATFGRPAFGSGHPHFVAAHGFNRRSDTARFGFHHFSPNRFGRLSANTLGPLGFHRFGGNQLFIGGWGCCGWGGAVPVSAPFSEPVGAPVIINISADSKPGDAGAASGGCVTHKLIYDGDGKYVGDQQSSHC